jgi:hypothetical protein
VGFGGALVGGGEAAGVGDATGAALGGGVAVCAGLGVETGTLVARGVADGKPATVVGDGEAAAVSPVDRGPIGDGAVGTPNVPMASANVARTRFRIPRATTSRARCAGVTTIGTPRPVGH